MADGVHIKHSLSTNEYQKSQLIREMVDCCDDVLKEVSFDIASLSKEYTFPRKAIEALLRYMAYVGEPTRDIPKPVGRDVTRYIQKWEEEFILSMDSKIMPHVLFLANYFIVEDLCNLICAWIGADANRLSHQMLIDKYGVERF